ncbi:hypothetical protein BDY21DRAFT_323682 [Lineolata rhizophorae]|uniref:Acetyl-CoA synthetase-like protein n=1 Tax=Lineolata rhizophorae TaxID=578093 RepID=A0A6A6NX75_9PEZI|nr:hypothetical protein BDY21DRAFT_323682 [Lineolata rhizophorae]
MAPSASSGPQSRLARLAAHFLAPSSAPEPPSATPTAPEPSPPQPQPHGLNFHALSPTFFLPRAAAIEPHAPAIHHVTSNGAILRRTYESLSERALGFAYWASRCARVSRVGLVLPNTPAFLEATFGVGAVPGAVLVPVNYRLKSEDVAYVLEHAGVEVVVVDQEFVGLVEGFRERNPRVRVLVDADTDVVEGELSGEFDAAVLEGLRWDRENGKMGWEGLMAQARDEEEVFALAYTSGTTARPKGVEYTHRGAYLAAMGNVIESGLNFHDGKRARYLWTLPMFHAMGWTFPWAVTAVRGTHYCLRKIDYGHIWTLLKHEGITHFNAAPTVNTLLCADPAAERLPQPVRVTVAASPPTPHLFELMTRLNLQPVHVYGLTETYGPITKGYFMPAWERLTPNEKYGRMARQGHGFVTSLPVRVVKNGDDLPEEHVEDVKRDGKEIGEVVFAGNICAKGYYKDEEATRKLFAGGVLHSGDLAVWHGDGAIQILDRAKDIIISGGENISSVALESMLAMHPDLLEAGVVAVPDSHWGERPKAFVTVQAGKELTGEDVIQWAKHQSAISKFMVPREVEVVPELPKTSTGKVKKNVLREWAKGADRAKIR